MIYNYRYNYSALYIDVSYKYVSRGTIKIIYIMIYRCVYIYIPAIHTCNTYLHMFLSYNNILDRYENSSSRTIFSFLYIYRRKHSYICRLLCRCFFFYIEGKEKIYCCLRRHSFLILF